MHFRGEDIPVPTPVPIYILSKITRKGFDPWEYKELCYWEIRYSGLEYLLDRAIQRLAYGDVPLVADSLQWDIYLFEHVVATIHHFWQQPGFAVASTLPERFLRTYFKTLFEILWPNESSGVRDLFVQRMCELRNKWLAPPLIDEIGEIAPASAFIWRA